jgi:dTDP-4-amino-4,6-dideoxygalactose transaminase
MHGHHGAGGDSFKYWYNSHFKSFSGYAMGKNGVVAMTRLAIDGGTPVRTASFPAWPTFDADEIDAVASVLRSGRVNYRTGAEGRQFEREFAWRCGVSSAVAVANGTVALELALYALGIGPGDEVVTPCRSYVASAGCVVNRGAVPIMADVDRDSQCLTAASIRQMLTLRTKAIIAVHLAGWPCDMDAIMDIAAASGLKVIEDCAQAQGARYKGRPVGSLGDMGAFSFCQDKIMTTAGEGGMLTTNIASAFDKAWSFRDHGRAREVAQSGEQIPGYRWVYNTMGTNWRLTEVQSAVGRRKLERLEASVGRRRELAGRLNQALAAIPALRTPRPPQGVEHAYYRCYTFVRRERLRPGWDRNRILSAIAAEGVPCLSGSCPEIYREKAFARFQPQRELRVARELGETSLAFLVHPTLIESDIQDMVEAVHKVMHHASA